jgi:hypothetical protein
MMLIRINLGVDFGKELLPASYSQTFAEKVFSTRPGKATPPVTPFNAHSFRESGNLPRLFGEGLARIIISKKHVVKQESFGVAGKGNPAKPEESGSPGQKKNVVNSLRQRRRRLSP